MTGHENGSRTVHLGTAWLRAVVPDCPEARRLLGVGYLAGHDRVVQLPEQVIGLCPHRGRHRWRNVDLLLVDDIQFLGNEEGAQDEFFHTFSTLHNAGMQIVITSDRRPKQLVMLEDRLRSGLDWCLIIDAQASGRHHGVGPAGEQVTFAAKRSMAGMPGVPRNPTCQEPTDYEKPGPTLRGRYLHEYQGVVPPMALIAPFARVTRSTNRSTDPHGDCRS